MADDTPEAPETSVGIESGASALPSSLIEVGTARMGTGLEHQPYRFTPEKKARFLELAPKYWPNVSAIAEAVGISRWTVVNHRKTDKAFDQALTELNNRLCDELEQTLIQQGLQPKGFLDRISYLRAHRPELYDRAKTIKIETKQMTGDERSSRLRVVESVIDAEVVGVVKGRRQKRIEGGSPQKPK